MKRIGSLVVALLLFVASPAEARWPKVERARTIAVYYWGGDAPAWPDHCGWVWTLKGNVTDPYLAWALPSECTIWIDRWWYDRYGRRRRTWSFFCTLYVHEWGHMLGYEHSDDPGNIMYPEIAAIPTPKPCR